MAKKHVTTDPGLGQTFSRRTTQKTINDNGSFNVKRIGANSPLVDIYHLLVQITWGRFVTIVLLFYFVMNLLFAGIYYSIGVEHLNGAANDTHYAKFLSSFFFSAQTFTTVGYGGISPKGTAASLVAATEALVGLMSFAIITGLVYGRFSRPTARIQFSKNALISPYEESKGLMFRIANKRRSEIIELSATVMMISMDKKGEGYSRNFDRLELEVDAIKFLPLNWTIVHPIDEKSPLFGKSHSFFEEHDVEFLVLVQAYDDTFNQTVYARYSYKWEEMVWGAKFVKPFYVNEEGIVVMDLTKLDDFETVSLPA
jgi:inward rectifier potassium channel